MSKEQLVAEAKKKFQREQLIAEAKAKYAAENEQPADDLSIGQKAANALRSGAEGLTLGLSEPVFSGIMAGEQHLKQSIQDAGSPGEFVENISNVEALKKQYEADVARRRQFKEQNPRTQMYSEVTGAALPALISGGATAPLSGAEMAATAIPAAVDATGNLASQAIRQIPKAAAVLESPGVVGSAARIAEAGAKSATQGVVGAGLQQEIEGSTGFLKPEEKVPLSEIAATSALLGGGMRAIPETITQGAKTLKGAAKVFTGVKPEMIDEYLARPEAIRNAKTIEEIKDEVDASVQRLKDDVDTAKISRDEAKDLMRQNQERVDDLIRENKNILSSQKADIKMQLRQAQSELNDAFKQKQAEIKTARLPIQADDVLDSVEDVKRQVSELSGESYKILGAEKGKVNIAKLPDAMERIKQEMTVGGEIISKDAKNAFDTVQGYQEKFAAIAEKNKGEVSFPQVKQLIQEIDKDIRRAGDKMAGDYNTDTYNALMGVRSELDSILKDRVAGYREVMEETAKMNSLRRDLVKAFGSREGATSKLSRIDAANLQNDRQLLTTLGERTGKDFKSPLDEYMATKAQGRTSVSLDQVKQNLPEYGNYVDALAQQARASRPEYGRALLEKAATASPEAQALRSSQTAYQSAGQSLDTAKAALEPYKRITVNNSENYIRTLMGDKTRKIELRRLMTGLGQISDQDFMQMINDLRVRETFEKGNAMGSSNVNLWAALGGGVGFALGDPTLGAATATAGAGFGKIMDVYGPKITRRVLDGMIYMKGIPTVQKINQAFADLPAPLRDQLKNDLIRAVSIGNSSEMVTVSPEDKAEISADIKNSEGLNSIEKANAINSINKKGAIDSMLMQKVMIGEEKAPDPAQPPELQNRPKAPRLEQITDFVKQRKPEAY